MKKIIIASLFVFGMGAMAQAQTTEKSTKTADVVKEAPATKAEAKSCCAGMATASKKECADTKTADSTNPQQTNETAAAPKAACTDKAAASSCCAGKAMASADKKEEKTKETAAPEK